jgi:hypothetical protein
LRRQPAEERSRQIRPARVARLAVADRPVRAALAALLARAESSVLAELLARAESLRTLERA